MPPNRHAVLSASSSHRWLHCNPSARLELEFEDRETEAAAEGTAAHALAEHKLRKVLKMRSTRPVSKYDSDEMEMYTDSYLEFVLEAIEEARQDCPDPKVLIEQRLDFSCYVPDGFGTGDCLIVADKLLHIIDLKYGQGVLVNAYEIKTGLSRAKLSHLMDAETWMNANKAVELGFADDLLFKADGECSAAKDSFVFSRRAVTNSLMSKVKSHHTPSKPAKSAGTPISELEKRLALIKP